MLVHLSEYASQASLSTNEHGLRDVHVLDTEDRDPPGEARAAVTAPSTTAPDTTLPRTVILLAATVRPAPLGTA